MTFTLATLLVPVVLNISAPDLADLDHFLVGDTFQSSFEKNDHVVIEDQSCSLGGIVCDTYSLQYSITSSSDEQAESRRKNEWRLDLSEHGEGARLERDCA